MGRRQLLTQCARLYACFTPLISLRNGVPPNPVPGLNVYADSGSLVGNHQYGLKHSLHAAVHPELADIKQESHPWLSLKFCFKSGRPDASKSKTCSAAETNMNVRPSSAVPVNKSNSKGQRRRENHNKHLSKTNLTSLTERTLADFWPPGSGRSVTHAPVCSEPSCHILTCRAEESSEQSSVVGTATMVPVVQRMVIDVAAAEVAAAEQIVFMKHSAQSRHLAGKVSSQDVIPTSNRLHGLSPWIPGTSGYAQDQTGAAPPHIRPQLFPIGIFRGRVVDGRTQRLLLQTRLHRLHFTLLQTFGRTSNAAAGVWLRSTGCSKTSSAL